MRKIICVLWLAVFILLPACGGHEDTTTDISYKTLQEIKQYIEDGVSDDAHYAISSITVTGGGGKLHVSVETATCNGAYLSPVAVAVVPLVLEQIDQYDLELGDIMVYEYADIVSRSNMIVWRTTNGETGTFSDDSGDKPAIKTNVSLEDLAITVEELSAQSKEPDNTPTSDSQTKMVWIPTNGGTKYHSNSSCSGMEEPKQVTKETAIASGYTACQRCF